MKAFGKHTELTGVIAASDMTAIGVLNQANSFGIAVPIDLSIVSIDGTEMCNITRPQLTSISQDFFQMGVIGVQMLQQSVADGSERVDSQQFLPVSAVNRKSVRTLD
jgi:LacI family transcriptional regulator